MKNQGRIRRFLFFALFTATIVMLLVWARSAFAYQHFTHFFKDGYASLYLHSEGVRFQFQRGQSLWLASQANIQHGSARMPARVFAFEYWHSPGGYARLDLSMRFGLLIFVLGFYPTLVLVVGRVRRRHRKRRNLCIDCAYSLTGNTSGICPECGTAIPAPPVQVTDERVDSPD